MPIDYKDDGSVVDDAVSQLKYYVKGLEKEERMKAKDATLCIDAELSLQTYPLPNDSEVEAPNIGAEPEIDGAPAVIGGIVQE